MSGWDLALLLGVGLAAGVALRGIAARRGGARWARVVGAAALVVGAAGLVRDGELSLLAQARWGGAALGGLLVLLAASLFGERRGDHALSASTVLAVGLLAARCPDAFAVIQVGLAGLGAALALVSPRALLAGAGLLGVATATAPGGVAWAVAVAGLGLAGLGAAGLGTAGLGATASGPRLVSALARGLPGGPTFAAGLLAGWVATRAVAPWPVAAAGALLLAATAWRAIRAALVLRSGSKAPDEAAARLAAPALLITGLLGLTLWAAPPLAEAGAPMAAQWDARRMPPDDRRGWRTLDRVQRWWSPPPPLQIE